jgi:hypothetical protein
MARTFATHATCPRWTSKDMCKAPAEDSQIENISLNLRFTCAVAPVM